MLNIQPTICIEGRSQIQTKEKKGFVMNQYHIECKFVHHFRCNHHDHVYTLGHVRAPIGW